ncbi:MAG TPA: DUF3566 domain-containing protein [Pilimelia sp.]|nr:DUF3566 domain-containing protein [Pilimelia sp.]
MTETQAKSGAAGAPTSPAAQQAADGGAPATGRAAVGRATVPTDSGSKTFTRAPGMSAPPDRPEDLPPGGGTAAVAVRPAPTSAPPVSAAPVSAAPVSAAPVSGAAPATGRAGVAPPGTRGPASGSGRPGAVGAARVTEAVRAARSTVAGAAARGPRRARLNLKRIDPWSVMKFSFAVSLVLFIVAIVATSVLYLALDQMEVFDKLNSSVAELITSNGADGTAESFQITAKGVIGTAALLGLVNVVLFTAIMTLGAFIYNVCADLVGGIEVTLAERD